MWPREAFFSLVDFYNTVDAFDVIATDFRLPTKDAYLQAYPHIAGRIILDFCRPWAKRTQDHLATFFGELPEDTGGQPQTNAKETWGASGKKRPPKFPNAHDPSVRRFGCINRPKAFSGLDIQEHGREYRLASREEQSKKKRKEKVDSKRGQN